jgi:hypothetical protein
MLLELELFLSQQGFPSRLYNVAGGDIRLSLESTIEGRFDGSRCVVPSGVAKKYVDAFWSANHSTRTSGGALCTGANGPRLSARLGFLPNGWTVRALGPDGPRVRRGGGRSPAAPGSHSREGPRQGGEILGDV